MFYIIGLPLAYVLALPAELEVMGLWIAVSLSVLIQTALYYYFILVKADWAQESRNTIERARLEESGIDRPGEKDELAIIHQEDEGKQAELSVMLPGADADDDSPYDPGDELEEMLGERASSDLDLSAREARAAELAAQEPRRARDEADDADYGTDVGNI